LAKRRTQRGPQVAFGRVFSWILIGGIGIFVIALAAQFITRMFVTPPVTSDRERTDLLVKAGERIQINVLNASGKPNLARIFTDYLRARKFDVVEMGNYPNGTAEASFVIDQVNDSVSARKIAYALGIDVKHIQRRVDTNAFVDAALVIGKDFEQLNPMKE
jgi:hypothetical protein